MPEREWLSEAGTVDKTATPENKKLVGKESLRKKYLVQRDEFFKNDAEEHQKSGRKIQDRVLAMKQVKTAETVFLYASYKSEAPTKELFEALRLTGKTVAFPKVNGKRMDFYVVNVWEDLKEGYRGILEPVSVSSDTANSETQRLQIKRVTPVFPKENDIILLPGAVFDKQGGRIGYGGGYYDRYLGELEAMHRKCPYLAGLCYAQQLYERVLPLEKHDRRMNAVITEQNVYDTEAELRR